MNFSSTPADFPFYHPNYQHPNFNENSMNMNFNQNRRNLFELNPNFYQNTSNIFEQRMNGFNNELNRIQLETQQLSYNFRDFMNSYQNGSVSHAPTFLSPSTSTILGEYGYHYLNTPNNNYVEVEPNSQEDVKVTISEEDFNKLNTFECLEDVNDSCSICCDNFKPDDRAIELHCEHFFHTECIKNWLLYEKTTCPNCRIDIRDTL